MNKEKLIYEILVATPKELGELVETINEEVFVNNDYNSIAVKAVYASLIECIDYSIIENNQFLAYGNEIIEVCGGNIDYTYNTRQALSNLKIVREAFVNPIAITSPIQEPVIESKDELCVETTSQPHPVSVPDFDGNIIKGVKGLAKYLKVGVTLAQAIISSKLLESNGAQYFVGGWNFNTKKIDELLKENPDLLKNVHIKRRKK